MHVTVAFDPDSPHRRFFVEFSDAIAQRHVLTMEYLSKSKQAQLERGEQLDLHASVLPLEMKQRLGITYVLGYLRNAPDPKKPLRNYRLDRVLSVASSSAAVKASDVPTYAADWLDSMGNGGDVAVVVVHPRARWLFEGIPGAEWGTIEEVVSKDEKLVHSVVRLGITLPEWFDRLMLRAGEGTYVISENFKFAGKDLAEQMGKSLRNLI
jgi:hypothetical protein